jgi:hypothetical protein
MHPLCNLSLKEKKFCVVSFVKRIKENGKEEDY